MTSHPAADQNNEQPIIYSFGAVRKNESGEQCAAIAITDEWVIIKRLFEKNYEGMGIGIYKNQSGMPIEDLHDILEQELAKSFIPVKDAGAANLELSKHELKFLGLEPANAVLDGVDVPAQYFVTPLQADQYCVQIKKTTKNGKIYPQDAESSFDLKNVQLFSTNIERGAIAPNSDYKRSQALLEFALNLNNHKQTSQLKLVI